MKTETGTASDCGKPSILYDKQKLVINLIKGLIMEHTIEIDGVTLTAEELARLKEEREERAENRRVWRELEDFDKRLKASYRTSN